MPSSDADLIQTWIQVWAHVRSVPVHEVDGWPQVHLASVTRETELICLEPGVETCRDLFRLIAGDPRAMLTIVGRDLDAYDRIELPAGVRLDRHDETLMTTDFEPLQQSVPDAGFTSGWDEYDHVATHWIEIDGRIAAEGSVGVLGAHATFDGVETLPQFRRRGLGRHVMANLTDHAIAAGARHGILAASREGRRLYESIGWEATLQMRSFMGA